MKYEILKLNHQGDVETISEVTVTQDAVTWNPEAPSIKNMLDTTPFFDPENPEADGTPVNTDDPDAWPRVPFVLHGSRLWCEAFEDDDAPTDRQPA